MISQKSNGVDGISEKTRNAAMIGFGVDVENSVVTLKLFFLFFFL